MAVRFVLLLLLATQSLCSSGLQELNTQAWGLPVDSHKKALSKLLPNKKASVGLHSANDAARNEGGCSWDNYMSQCGVSLSATAEHFSQSDSGYAQLIAQFATCEALGTADVCNADDNCLWDSEHLRCGFAQIDVGHEDSPCVAEAPAMTGVYIYSQICTALKDNSTCVANSKCTWDEVCDADDWLFLYKFTHKDFNEVISYKSLLYIDQFTKEFDPSKAVFTYEDILDWDPVSTDCPEDSPSLTCDFADAIYKSELPVVIYCNIKYSQFFQFPSCLQDPLCNFDYSSLTCSASEKIAVEAVIHGLEILNPSIEQEADREIMKTILDCAKFEGPSDCTGSCMWFESEGGSCGIGDVMWMSKVAELGEGTDDPVCMYISTLANSGCVDIEDSEECLDNTNCVVQIYDECTPSTDYLIADVLTDEAIAATYSELQEQCSAYDTADTCEAASDSSES